MTKKRLLRRKLQHNHVQVKPTRFGDALLGTCNMTPRARLRRTSAIIMCKSELGKMRLSKLIMLCLESLIFPGSDLHMMMSNEEEEEDFRRQSIIISNRDPPKSPSYSPESSSPDFPLLLQLEEDDDDDEMATSKKVITREEWEKKLNAVKLRKEDMNTLVMNFLVTEGFVEAAEKFQRESGTKPEIDLATITDRMAVKKAVQNGNVEDAIEKVNDLNPEILDTNPELFFHLQQQRLIELIRQGKTEEALEFAQEELAPRGEENQAFLEELEKTVALLVFEDASNCPVKDLLDISHRLKTASEVNAAILTSQSHEKDPKLPSLLKMLIWAQNQLDEKAVYPHISDLSTGKLEDPTE
ncbi:unnamed protein product [Microthlaspi erraticum]|uniref:CTLH domain-containing protein n=1 Tax=Microthlaspi erraticum TaxID=1685480 RepID=A0A6D2IHH7_9BRAS|nr:unnamed protein product [Microthlaspi erraticum]